MGAQIDKESSLGDRLAGILLHPTSLPGGHGIGDIGNSALRFIDFLSEARHRVWHVLPTGPGVDEEFHSPYATISAFANNPLLISLDQLVEDGLLGRDELRREVRQAASLLREDRVDYRAVERFKMPLLRKAALSFDGARAEAALESFCSHHPWVQPYAQFVALRMEFGAERSSWPTAFRSRRNVDDQLLVHPGTRQEVRNQMVLQHLFAEQWSQLRKYAHQRGVKLYGDLPLYVSGAGADVWANPELFALERATGAATAVSGVPPDMCNADGQRWGHPLYDWARMKADNYCWWIERFRSLGKFFDVARVDHFPGFVQYWSIPADAASAREGAWMPGPGADFLVEVQRQLGALSVYVEDLGVDTREVGILRDQFGLMGLRILQYAFDGDEREFHEGDHSPSRVPLHSVVCTGNHDNSPIAGWFANLSEALQKRVQDYLGGCPAAEVPDNFVRLAMSLPARLSLVQMQDVLGLGNEARMNRPGVLDWSNWSWRLREIPDRVAPRLAQMAEESGRLGASCRVSTEH